MDTIGFKKEEEFSEKNYTKLIFNEKSFDNEEMFVSFYLKQFDSLVNLIQENKLILHNTFPNQKICQVNHCFVLNRSFTATMDRIIYSMSATKLKDEKLKRLSSMGQFYYIDGILKSQRNIGIRVIKIKEKVKLNEEYIRLFPYIMVHFYEREVKPELFKKVSQSNSAQHVKKANIYKMKESQIEKQSYKLQIQEDSSTNKQQDQQSFQTNELSPLLQTDKTQPGIYDQFKEENIQNNDFVNNQFIYQIDRNQSNNNLINDNQKSFNFCLEIQQADIIKKLNQRVIELEKKNIKAEIQNKNYEILFLQQREVQLNKIEEQLNNPIIESINQNVDINQGMNQIIQQYQSQECAQNVQPPQIIIID